MFNILTTKQNITVDNCLQQMQLSMVVTRKTSSSARNLQLKQIVIVNLRTEHLSALMRPSDCSKSV